MSSNQRVPDQIGIGRGVKPVIISTVSGVAVCIAMLLLFSLILSTQNIPQAAVSPMATAAVSLGALAAGYVCAKMLREKGLMWGLICGVILSFVVLLASFGLSGSGLGIPALFKVVFILLCSMLGGVMGVNTRHKRKHAKGKKHG